MPQAVARAVARRCVDVSGLQPKLLRASLSLLVLHMLENTRICRFRFWEPEKVPNPCRAHASSSCARRCAQLCGFVAAAAQVAAYIVVSLAFANIRKTLVFRFRFWEPEKVPNPCRAHASSSCARGCAQLRGCVAAACQVAARIVVIFGFAHVRKNTDLQVPILGT